MKYRYANVHAAQEVADYTKIAEALSCRTQTIENVRRRFVTEESKKGQAAFEYKTSQSVC